MNKLLKIYGFAFLGGLLLWLAWPTMPATPLVFVGFVPLLYIEKIITNTNWKRKGWIFFSATYLHLFTWNITTTWWIWNASQEGAVLAIILNALLMSIPFVLYRKTKMGVGDKWGNITFVLYFVSFEYLHLNWDLSWPWLTLGNVFAMHPNWVQWYEITGALGGTVWVLIGNLIVFGLLTKFMAKQRFHIGVVVISILVIVCPYFISLLFKNNETNCPGENVISTIVLVQPNIDPYTEKYQEDKNFVPYKDQFQRLIKLSEEKITDNTSIVAWPETAMPFEFWESNLETNPFIQELKKWTDEKGVVLIAGVNSYKKYSLDNAPANARKLKDFSYVAYNTALRISGLDSVEIYHKSKLVPGVEQLPYPELFQFVEKYAINLGGTTGTLGRQKERSIFKANELIAAPVICYESVFGEFVGDYVNKGANVIVVITNDAWWGETEGHRQHFHYARLRAVENRMHVVRSANTGISGSIDKEGKILQQLPYRTQGAIVANVTPSREKTFYSKYGDILGRLALFVSTAMLLSAIVKKKIIK